MTLFIKTSTRSFEINDFYIMVLCFIIGALLAKITSEVREKLLKRLKTKKIIAQGTQTQVSNPRGGKLDFSIQPSIQPSDDYELASIILTCVQDDAIFLVMDERLKVWIFKLVKAKIKNESLSITPNLLRYIASTVIKRDTSLITSVGGVLFAVDRVKLLSFRAAGSLIIGYIAFAANIASYGVLLLIMYFQSTSVFCNVPCDQYFHRLPDTDGVVEIFSENRNGNLVIGGNDEAKPVEVYEKIGQEYIKNIQNEGDEDKVITIEKRYKKSKKAKIVKFSQWKKNDPVLSQFENIEEPKVPQWECDTRRQIGEQIRESLE